MAHTVLIAIAAIFGAWFVSCVHRLYINYRNAVKSGLPYIIIPLDQLSVPHILLNLPLLGPAKRFLPKPLFERFHMTTVGWEFRDRNNAYHERLGPAFVMVTIGENELWTADPALTQALTSRRKDVLQLPVAKQCLSIMGTNALSSDGEVWARQRRMIAPGLNESISSLVWQESLSQAGQMSEYIRKQDEGVSAETTGIFKAIAINVLGSVGYGQHKPFKPRVHLSDPKAKMEYVDAISMVPEFLVQAALVHHAILSLPIWSKTVQTLGAAMRKLPALTAELIAKERLRLKTEQLEGSGDDSGHDAGKHGRHNIMSTLVRLADNSNIIIDNNNNNNNNGSAADTKDTAQAAARSRHSNNYLTEDELSGNLFLLTVAGYDTTANTMAYTAVLLSAYPEAQAWVQEELDRVLGEGLGGSDAPPLSPAAKAARLREIDYATYYPRLVRTLALMNEVLRLYMPVPHLSRKLRLADAPHTITLRGKTHELHGVFNLFFNFRSMQLDKTAWGADASEFRPQRWIEVDDSGNESLRPAPGGFFMPWSTGPRTCPGMKMSQVEFVAVMATALWQFQVRPVKASGESDAAAQARMAALADDSQTYLTLVMNHPEKAVLQWVSRC
ncbi:MAG: hypothetical protein STHCBS139747_005397 [Sporothrix thermara]